MMPTQLRYIFAILICLSGTTSLAKKRGELRLAPALTRELELVLSASDALHRSLAAQNEEQIEIGIRDVIVQIQRARTFTHLAKPYERGHLARILDAAHDQFELTRSSFGDERLLRLEDGFNQLVNLVRIYRLDRAYAIYFCPKDRTTWVQKGVKIVNPFRHDPTDRQPCGVRVVN